MVRRLFLNPDPEPSPQDGDEVDTIEAEIIPEPGEQAEREKAPDEETASGQHGLTVAEIVATETDEEASEGEAPLEEQEREDPVAENGGEEDSPSSEDASAPAENTSEEDVSGGEEEPLQFAPDKREEAEGRPEEILEVALGMTGEAENPWGMEQEPSLKREKDMFTPHFAEEHEDSPADEGDANEVENDAETETDIEPENAYKEEGTPDEAHSATTEAADETMVQSSRQASGMNAETKEKKAMAHERDEYTLRFGLSDEPKQRARLTVIGVGGAGSNAVDNMIASDLGGVDFVAVNTDAQALDASRAPKRVQIGRDLTRGLGAGGDPDQGRQSAEENLDELGELFDGVDMVFVAAGMGGGTGTGAAPIITDLAKQKDILTVGIVTKPFKFEGKKRARRAEEGIARIKEAVDTLIVIPNDRLLLLADKNLSFEEGFRKADDVLYQATKGISDIINYRGKINMDLKDVRTVMKNGGDSLMGVGIAGGEKRAQEAAEQAITSPLLDRLGIDGAKALLININSSENLGMLEMQDVVEKITEHADEDAEVIVGVAIDESLGDRISVTVIATGFDSPEANEGKMKIDFQSADGEHQSSPPTNYGPSGSAGGSNGSTNGGSNGGSNGGPRANGGRGTNGHSATNTEFVRVEADPKVLEMDTLPDMPNIDPNNRELPAFLRRNRPKK